MSTLEPRPRVVTPGTVKEAADLNREAPAGEMGLVVRPRAAAVPAALLRAAGQAVRAVAEQPGAGGPDGQPGPCPRRRAHGLGGAYRRAAPARHAWRPDAALASAR